METNIERLEDNRVKVTVTVDAKDVGSRFKSTYKDLAGRYNFPGFRKGKAPRQVIDSALGKESVQATVTDDLVNELFPLSVDESGLFPVGQPDFDDPDLVQDGADYSFSYTIELRPEVELTSYDPVEIELPTQGVSEAEVDDQVNTFLQYYYTYEDAGDDAKVQAESCVDLAIQATDDAGEPIESLNTEGRPYTLGEGLLPASFDRELLGLGKGDEKSFSIDMPMDPPAALSAVADSTKTVGFEVSVQCVKEKTLPELTDEWVKERLHFDSVEELRRILADSIQQQKDMVLPQLRETAVLEAVAKRYEGEAPDSAVEEAESSLLQSFFQQLQGQGQTFDAYLAQHGMSSDQFKDDVHKQAVDSAKQDIALDAWARHFELEASDEDLRAEFDRSGLDDPEQAYKEWRSAGRLHIVREAVLRTKAVDHLIDTAIVTERDTASSAEADEGEGDEAEAEPAAEPAADAPAE